MTVRLAINVDDFECFDRFLSSQVSYTYTVP